MRRLQPAVFLACPADVTNLSLAHLIIKEALHSGGVLIEGIMIVLSLLILP